MSRPWLHMQFFSYSYFFSPQTSDMVKRASVLLGADANGASVFPLPEGGAPLSEKEVVAEVKEGSGTFEIQHAKLQPGWKQVNYF